MTKHIDDLKPARLYTFLFKMNNGTTIEFKTTRYSSVSELVRDLDDQKFIHVSDAEAIKVDSIVAIHRLISTTQTYVRNLRDKNLDR